MCSSDCERVSMCGLEEMGPRPTRNSNSTRSSSENWPKPLSRPSKRPAPSLHLSLLCLALILSVTLEVESAVIAKRRAISAEDTSTSSEKETKECHNTPCGWGVYIKSSRRIDYYIRNVCRCPAEKECLKSEDDLSANAYVYRCKVRDSPPINKGND